MDKLYGLRATTFAQIQPELETLKIVPYVHSLDKYGCPYLYLDASKHLPAQFDLTISTIRLLHFMLWHMMLDLIREDKECSQLRKGISLFVDVSEFQLKNLDNSGLSTVLRAFLDSYPCHIGNIYMLAATKVFKSNDKLVAQLPPEIAKKVQWIERWTMVMPVTSVPTGIGGKGADFDLAAYRHRFQPEPPAPDISVEPERRGKMDEYSEVFGIYHPVAQISAHSFLESMQQPEGNGTEHAHSLYFNQEHIDNAIKGADQDLEQYRLAHNQNVAVPMATTRVIFGSDENLLPTQRYSKWVQNRWTGEMSKIDEEAAAGEERRFNDTDYYEGVAYDRLKQSEMLNHNST